MPIPSPSLERPRLLATSVTWPSLGVRRSEDPRLDAFLAALESDARDLLPIAPSTYEMTGRRLLFVSRVVLRRVLLLSLAYHTTSDLAFARRAEAEMLAAARFPDWNPSHFLDTAEMTTGLAIGYDWLHEVLTPEGGVEIARAIHDKGLLPVFPEGRPHDFVHAPNNWNQVCLAGVTLGALAVWEDDPNLARRVIELVPEFNRHGQDPYAPDGIYPEGPIYWGYGTGFEVVLLDALRRAFGTDFDLGSSPGFLTSAGVQLQLTAPSGQWFNFSDCREGGGLEPPIFWFAHELNRPALLHFENRKLDEKLRGEAKPDTRDGETRLLPLAALWWLPSDVQADSLPLHWHGDGPNPVAVFRSSWRDPEASYLAIKGGGAFVSHAHMDAGSFVYESRGVRWAHDLGLQDYHSLESVGVNMWNSDQGGQRWQVFRIGPFSHNTLTIDGQEHNRDGRASMKVDGAQVTLDLTPLFLAEIEKATRKFHYAEEAIEITDELEGLIPGTRVRWSWMTQADISIEGNRALLRQSGRALELTFECHAEMGLNWAPADPPNWYDAPNPGFNQLTAVMTTPESGRIEVKVIASNY